jgi:hypothetical protein
MTGRPLKFKSPEELQKAIDGYFDKCIATQYDKELGKNIEIIVIPPTVSGLAVELDTTRQTLVDYEGKDGFIDTIKKAKQKIESYAERALVTNRNPAGVIFSLKNNYGWVDKQEITANINHVTIVDDMDNSN